MTRRDFTAELTDQLCNALRYAVRYDTPEKNSKGEWETRIERNARFGQSDKTPERPELPEYARHVWEWFMQISRQRQGGFNGPEPISWRDIAAWRDLTGTLITDTEIEMLVAMDAAYREQAAKERDERNEAEKGKK